MKNFRLGLILLLIFLLLGLTGCGGSSPKSDQQQQNAPSESKEKVEKEKVEKDKVSLRLDWLLNGYAIPFVAALEQGYYEEQGIDIVIQEGKGSAVTAQVVGNKSETFGFADASTVAKLISEGMPVKVVSVYLQMSPIGVSFMPKNRVDKPENLKGKSIALASGDSGWTALKSVLGKYKLTEKDLNIKIVDPAAKTSALLSGTVDLVSDYSAGGFVDRKIMESKLEMKLYADWGVNLYNGAILVHNDTISQNPELIKRFLAASQKGWELAIKNPEEAVKIALKRFPGKNQEVLTAGLKESIRLLYTEKSKGKPLGYMVEEDWKQTIELLNQYGEMKEVKPLNTYYTNEFLPLK